MHLAAQLALALQVTALGLALGGADARKPNVLLLVTDQERAAPPYEPQALRDYRAKHLLGRAAIAENGIALDNHYVTSTACVSSRACLYTGQHLSMHGVDSTTGIAKQSDDPEVTWLSPGWIPTMGDYFRVGGYDTAYFGKWHVSDEDIVVGGRAPPVRTSDGAFDLPLQQAYEDADKLAKFGFGNWTGPEPHGADFENSGTVRDVEYTEQIVSWLRAKNASASTGEEEPWMMAANLVNPHDICLMQAMIWALFEQEVDDGSCPQDLPPPPTAGEDLAGMPSVYRQYVSVVNTIFSRNRRRIWSERDETCFYYFLHKRVDAHIARIYETLRDTVFFEDTIVILTSDHGEMLGAHGGAIEKWHNFYDEATRVPLVVSNPRLFRGRQAPANKLTSHLDLLPTMLELAGIDEAQAAAKLADTHSVVKPLPGASFARTLLESGEPEPAEETVFFYTRDNVFQGPNQALGIGKVLGPLGNLMPSTPYDAPYGPNSLQGIVHRSADGRRFKLIEYFDDPGLWSSPGLNHTYIIKGANLPELGPRGTLLSRSTPLPSEFQLFDLDADPIESTNLYSADHPRLPELKAALAAARRRVLQAPGKAFPAQSPLEPRDHAVPIPSLILRLARLALASLAALVLLPAVLRARSHSKKKI